VGVGAGVEREDWPFHTLDGSPIGSCHAIILK
jgi:hypothetical protein